MKVNVFDCYKVIKNHEGYVDFDEELLEKFDAMLTQVGIGHAFTECRTEDIDKYEGAVVTVCYNEEDATKFFLAYGLFCQTYRGAESDFIKKAMLKHIAE